MTTFPSRFGARLGGWVDVGSRLVVLASTAAALYFEASLGSRGWYSLLPIAIGSAAAMWAIARWRPRIAWFAVLVSLYLSPLVFRIVLNRELTEYATIWMAGCFGAILAGGVMRGWRFPARWRAPLTYWALAVALIWPFIVFREADFWWPLMHIDRIGNSGNGGPPAVIAVWIANVALTHLIGLLWFETAASQPVFAGEGAFNRNAVVPLAIGAGVGCALAVYQGTVDINWLSAHQWGAENRAAGSLLDGDAFGALAALWALGFLAIAARANRRASQCMAVVFAAVAFGAVWATGSRIAFLGAAIGVLFVAAAIVSLLRSSGVARPRPAVVAAVIAVLVIAVGGVLKFSSNESPVARLRATLPSLTEPAVQKFLDKEVWNRGGPYGDMSVAMVKAFPASGVGVGSFNHLFPDWAYERSLRLNINEGRYPFDNAQSWCRHQLAELGVVGSRGWIVWVVWFGAILVFTGGRAETRAAAWLIKGSLVVVALVATVSMPTQNSAVSFTVWVFTAWYLNLSPRAGEMAGLRRAPAERLWPWGLVIAALAIFVMTSVRAGHERLRPPMRALMANWGYRYGFHGVEMPADNSLPYAWTSATRSVDVVPSVPGNWLEVTISSGPPDIKEHPLHLQLLRGAVLVSDMPRFTGESHTWYIRVKPGEWGVMIQINADRTWNPASFGGTDSRPIGVRVAERLQTSEQLRNDGTPRIY